MRILPIETELLEIGIEEMAASKILGQLSAGSLRQIAARSELGG